MHFDVQDEQILKLEQKLKWLAKDAVPFATLKTLNQAVAVVQGRVKATLPKKFTLRNQWTAGSIQIRKARGLDIDRQAAQVGSTALYMAEQEEGFTRRGRGKHGYPVPTAYAGGEGAAKKRTRPIRKAFRMSSIRLARVPRGGLSREQRNVIAVKEAIATRKRFAYLDNGRDKGIYKITGGRSTKKSGWPKGATPHLVWSLSRKVIMTKPHRWFGYHLDRVNEFVPTLYRRALANQLKRLNI